MYNRFIKPIYDTLFGSVSIPLVSSNVQAQNIVDKKKQDVDSSFDWGYETTNGPHCWAALNPNYKLCALGKRQSPIDIKSSSTVEDENNELHIKYADITDGNIIHNGRTIMVSCNYNNDDKQYHDRFISFLNEKYYLKQFHFHTPAEHQIDSTQRDMCAHFVHESIAGMYVCTVC